MEDIRTWTNASLRQVVGLDDEEHKTQVDMVEIFDRLFECSILKFIESTTAIKF